MNNIKLTIVFVCFLVFFTPALLSLGIRFLPGNQMPETGGSRKVYIGNTLNFEVKNPDKNLVGVVVRVKNSIRANVNLTLQLFDGNDQVVVESVVNGLSILDGSEVRFSFSLSTLKGGSLQGIFTSDAIEQNAMEIYLERDSNSSAYVLLYKPASRLGLIGGIYSGWLKHLFGVK